MRGSSLFSMQVRVGMARRWSMSPRRDAMEWVDEQMMKKMGGSQ